MKILFAPEVDQYLTELIQLLFDKGYFSFYEDADKYVTSLILDIKASLNRKLKKRAPLYFLRYGKDLYYSVFKKNTNTQWFVFFNGEDDMYYIRYIGNNHTVSQYFI